MVQAPANSHQLIEIEVITGEQPKLSLPKEAKSISSRISPLIKIGKLAAEELIKHRHSGQIAIQVHDESPGVPCLRFDADVMDHMGPPLIPDPYCLASNGFADLIQEFEKNHPLPPWHERLPFAFWRGSTTGLSKIDVDLLPALPRYQLCNRTNELPTMLNAQFTNIVQSVSKEEKEKIRKQLLLKNLLAPRTSPWHGALNQWLIDIDGNVNSWGLLWKLLSGSCVIHVLSQHQQWYHNQLRPMQHFIPVKQDLSDLEMQLSWCHKNKQECSQIASNGRSLAHKIVRNLESDIMRSIKEYTLKWVH